MDLAKLGITVDSTGARRGLDDVKKALDKTGKAAQDFKRTAGNKFDELKGQVFSLKTAMVGLATSFVTRQMFTAIANYEQMEKSLRVVTGSAKGAASAMAFLNDFVKTTPFELQELTNAFIKLNQFGLEASSRSLKAFGNLAAATGKPIEQLVETVGRATLGGFEGLRELGIKAQADGDKLALTFRGTTTTIGNNAREIERYLIRLGEIEFSGAMADQADTLNGKLTLLKTTLNDTWVSIGNIGAREGATGLMDTLIASLEEVNFHLRRTRVYALSAVGAFEELRIKGKAQFEILGQFIRNYNPISDFADGIANASLEITQLGMRFKWLAATMSGDTAGADALDTKISNIQKMQKMLSSGEYNETATMKTLVDMEKQLAITRQTLSDMLGEEVKFIAQQEEVGKSFKGIETKATGAAKAIETYTSTAGEQTDAMKQQAEEVKAIINAGHVLSAAEQQNNALLSLMGAGLITMEQYRDAYYIMVKDVEKAGNDMQAQAGVMSEFAKNAAQSIQSSFADFLFDPFEGGLKGMAEGLANTLRRMIAEIIAAAIMKRMVNAMAGSSMGWVAEIGMAAGGEVAATQHSGGVVGTGARRGVSPAAFLGAQRYHSGGIVGGEVPIIARQGEEVLTESDPRHRRNGRGMGGATFNIMVQSPNGTLEKESLSQLQAAMAQSFAINQQRNR